MFRILGSVVLVWLGVSYLLIPLAWEYYADRHPSFDNNPRVTETSTKHPGDPLNIGLVGTPDEVRAIMRAAHWSEASPLGIVSDLRIGADSILNRPDHSAPVSNLYLFGRKEDLAFEQQVSGSPRHRHHVRLWRTRVIASDGRPSWIGAAVYDEKVGLSRTTGQITHVTAADVDVERDYLLQCLMDTKMLAEQYTVQNFHTQRTGRNGGGDPWKTDGNLRVGVIADLQ